jgi:serine/threonine protein phosphatase PrpC
MTKYLRRLFAKKEPETISQIGATAPLSDSQLWDSYSRKSKESLSYLVSGSALDKGRRRENNEDAVLCFTGSLSTGPESQPFGVYAVADGMGGHRSGEVASEIALRALGNYLIQKLYGPLFGPNPQPTKESLRELMEAAVQEANRAVKGAAPGGGCTLTAALVVGRQLVIAHLGDSRAYAIYRDGRIKTLTQDHSLVKRLQEMGQLSAEEAAVHPQKSVLYRALGQSDALQADIFNSSLPSPGFLLLCSDGLWGSMDEETIQNIVNNAPGPFLACHQLVEAANLAGGPDNISAVVVRMVG